MPPSRRRAVNAPARFSPAALPCDEIPARRPGRCPLTEGREELAYDQPRARSGRHRPCAMPSPGFPKLPDPNTHSSAAPRTGKCAMRGPIPRPRCCVEEARRRIIELPISLTLCVDERSLTGSVPSAFLSRPGRRRYGIFEITDLGSGYQRLFLQYHRPRA
jgi:hypothetical protein